jgi:membrane protease subunit HflK
MALLYAGSGITVIPPDQVALVERWGRLVGDSPGTQLHGPGLLWAWPRPVDRVLRVSTQRIWQVDIATLAAPPGQKGGDETLDPLRVGYALTGDQNIVQLEVLASYRIQDPVAWAFHGPDAEGVLRSEITAALVRSLGEMGVDEVLAAGRKKLVGQATIRAQAGLDTAHSGLALVSLQLRTLAPPQALKADFDKVQSTYIEAETARSDARAFAQSVVPRAQADADAQIQEVRGGAATLLAQARGARQAFLDLARQYQANPEVVQEGLYRDNVDAAISNAGEIRWIPPPTGGSHGVRLIIGSEGLNDLPSGDRPETPRLPPSSPEPSPSPGQTATPPSEDRE